MRCCATVSSLITFVMRGGKFIWMHMDFASKILNYLSYLFLKWKRYVSSSKLLQSGFNETRHAITCDQQRKKLSPLTCDNHCWISARSASYVYLRSFSFNRSFNSLCNLTKKPKIYLKTIYYDKHNE